MKTLKIFGISVLVILFGLLLYGGIITKKDVIVKSTSDYLYVKEYSWYNRDSTVYRYPATKIYQGVVKSKYSYSNFVGVVGKGGHYRTNYRTTVSYNNKQHTFTGYSVYHKYKKRRCCKNKSETLSILFNRYNRLKWKNFNQY